jgi:hypothetical protein
VSTTLDARAESEPRPIVRVRSVPLYWVVLRVLGSLQLTVGLFALAMVLVFFGTLAQIDKGTQTVVEQYFRSWYVRVPNQLLAEFGKRFFVFPQFGITWAKSWEGFFYFPGGWLIGGVMLANLIAAHLTRFKLSWRRAGVITIHLGVILLMAGELVTGLYAVESRMVLQVGESASYIDHSRHVELAFHDASTGQTITIPQSMLKSGRTITHPQLPVDVEVTEYFTNTTLKPADSGDDSAVLLSKAGGRYWVVPAEEESGVKSEQREDVPGVRVRLLEKGTDKAVAERLFSLWEYRNGPSVRQFRTIPFTVTDDGGHAFTVQLRNERIHKPYTITLREFEHANYAGTDTAKDFASTVSLVDPETGDQREVRIWMNHPLRHGGETFYQSGTIPGDQKDSGTVLQVVRNPGWLLPYLSCIVVTLGMLIHFGMNLVKFTNRRAA